MRMLVRAHAHTQTHAQTHARTATSSVDRLSLATAATIATAASASPSNIDSASDSSADRSWPPPSTSAEVDISTRGLPAETRSSAALRRAWGVIGAAEYSVSSEPPRFLRRFLRLDLWPPRDPEVEAEAGAGAELLFGAVRERSLDAGALVRRLRECMPDRCG